jgi:hypothetical protein
MPKPITIPPITDHCLPITDFTDYRLQNFTDYRLLNRLRLRLRLRRINAKLSSLPPITDFTDYPVKIEIAF